MYKMGSITGAFALALLPPMIIVGCNGDDSSASVASDAGAQNATPEAAASRDAPAAPTATPTDDAAAFDAGALDAEVETLEDGQIAQLVLAASQSEVAHGRIAQTFGVTPQVQAFATQMVTEHTAMMERQQAVFRTLGLTLADSATSRRLQATFDLVIAQMRALPPDLERIYIDSQVWLHAEIVRLIDRDLLPAASAPELRVELESMRAAISSHFDAALAIQKRIPRDAGRGW